MFDYQYPNIIPNEALYAYNYIEIKALDSHLTSLASYEMALKAAIYSFKYN